MNKFKDMTEKELYEYLQTHHIRDGREARQWTRAIRKRNKENGVPFWKRDFLPVYRTMPYLACYIGALAAIIGLIAALRM